MIGFPDIVAFCAVLFAGLIGYAIAKHDARHRERLARAARDPFLPLVDDDGRRFDRFVDLVRRGGGA